MRIALAQILTGADPDANLELVADAAREAADAGARMVVFPEATMRAFGAGRLDEIAEPLDGPWASRVADIAGECGLVVVVGMFTPGDGGRVRNTLLVTGPAVQAAGGDGGPDGRHLHEGYDKIHLFDAFGFSESDTVAPGEQTLVVQVDGVGIGLSVCYDLRFPGQFRALAGAGAEVILCSASWGAGPGKVEQWRLLAQARALDSTSFLVATGQADPAACGVEVAEGAPTGVGHSLVARPDGRVLAEAGADREVLVVDLDLAEVGEVRESVPVLANGRVTEDAHEVGAR